MTQNHTKYPERTRTYGLSHNYPIRVLPLSKLTYILDERVWTTNQRHDIQISQSTSSTPPRLVSNLPEAVDKAKLRLCCGPDSGWMFLRFMLCAHCELCSANNVFSRWITLGTKDDDSSFSIILTA